jgi:hypothetical protein
MISGLGASGIALAVRTASTARQAVSDTTRQIATGQTVASVRDDGAAWVRGNAARVEIRSREVIGTIIADNRLRQTVKDAGIDLSRQLTTDLRNAAITASQAAPGSATFTAAREGFLRLWDAAIRADHLGRYGVAYAGGVGGEYDNPASPGDAAFQVSKASVLTVPNPDGTLILNTTTGRAEMHGAYTASGVAGGSWYLQSATGGRVYFVGTVVNGNWNLDMTTPQRFAEAAQYMADVFSNLGVTSTDARGGALAAALDRLERVNTRMSDTAEGARSAALDADLSKVSARRATAQSRQDLALQTVRTALDAYGAFAGGLLGNIQRTQRALA